ncbi:cupin domain-containing protein [Spongorhabdus nitratireducens]
MLSAAGWIKYLGLQPHPEGGWYRRVYTADFAVPEGSLSKIGIEDERPVTTAIYYLLTGDGFSAFHRIRQDELWHYYGGTLPLKIHTLSDKGYELIRLGSGLSDGGLPMGVVPAGRWFASELDGSSGPEPGPEDFALLGCTVSPGFDFDDFEFGCCSELLPQFPDYAELIKQFCITGDDCSI